MDKAQFTTDALLIVNGALELLEAEIGVKLTLETYKVRLLYICQDYVYCDEDLYELVFKIKSPSNQVYCLRLPPSMAKCPKFTTVHFCSLTKDEEQDLCRKIEKQLNLHTTLLQVAIICEAA